jgi:hypothetical protein
VLWCSSSLGAGENRTLSTGDPGLASKMFPTLPREGVGISIERASHIEGPSQHSWPSSSSRYRISLPPLGVERLEEWRSSR